MDVEHSTVNQGRELATDGQFADSWVAVQCDDHVRDPITDVYQVNQLRKMNCAGGSGRLVWPIDKVRRHDICRL